VLVILVGLSLADGKACKLFRPLNDFRLSSYKYSDGVQCADSARNLPITAFFHSTNSFSRTPFLLFTIFIIRKIIDGGKLSDSRIRVSDIEIAFFGEYRLPVRIISTSVHMKTCMFYVVL